MSRADARLWRRLVDRAALAAADPEHPHPELRTMQAETRGLMIPATSYADQAAFVALAAMSRAYSVAATARRASLANGLQGLADECRAVMGRETATRPPTSAPNAPRWLSRADCGGQ